MQDCYTDVQHDSHFWILIIFQDGSSDGHFQMGYLFQSQK